MIEKMFYKQRADFEVSSAKRDQELEFPERCDRDKGYPVL